MFNRISADAFKSIQKNAGMLCTDFDPSKPAEIADKDIITATTGGIQISAVPTFEDFGADIDNCPNNTKELKQITEWVCTIGSTALNPTAKFLKMALGAADIEGSKVTPRAELKLTDFETIWWVGPRVDGGFVAAKLFNALSTAGLSMQTTKGGKATLPFTLTGHVSIDNTDIIPMEFYSIDGETEDDGKTDDDADPNAA